MEERDDAIRKTGMDGGRARYAWRFAMTEAQMETVRQALEEAHSRRLADIDEGQALFEVCRDYLERD